MRLNPALGATSATSTTAGRPATLFGIVRVACAKIRQCCRLAENQISTQLRHRFWVNQLANKDGWRASSPIPHRACRAHKPRYHSGRRRTGGSGALACKPASTCSAGDYLHHQQRPQRPSLLPAMATSASRTRTTRTTGARWTRSCDCYTCQGATAPTMHHLFRVGEDLGAQLNRIRNLHITRR